MGRKIVKVETTSQVVDWIFNIEVDLNVNTKPKIAFLSGLGRSCFPDDAGFSKFGLVYQLNIDENPPCEYLPSDDRLQKPVSRLGYGIGGLSGPRFAISRKQDLPSPDKYQREVNAALIDGHRKKVPAKDEVYKFPSTDPYVIRKKLELRQRLARQCMVSFGTLKSTPKYGNSPRFETAGVGSYNIKEREDVKNMRYATASFGRQPLRHDSSTEIKCIYVKDEFCIECGKEFGVSDFYRSRYVVRVPLPENRPVADLPSDFPTGVSYVNLCNICYYIASQGHSKNWPSTKLKWQFRKTRTCATIHDHQDLPEIIHKADCKMVRKLKMKESILAKYYRDRVEDSVFLGN